MKYSDTKAVVDESLTFPAEHPAVVDQVGAVEISSPKGESVTIQEILDRVEVDRYDSSDELYTAIIGNLDDSFIGRKHYDDRGGVPAGTGDEESEVSF